MPLELLLIYHFGFQNFQGSVLPNFFYRYTIIVSRFQKPNGQVMSWIVK